MDTSTGLTKSQTTEWSVSSKEYQRQRGIAFKGLMKARSIISLARCPAMSDRGEYLITLTSVRLSVIINKL